MKMVILWADIVMIVDNISTLYVSTLYLYERKLWEEKENHKRKKMKIVELDRTYTTTEISVEFAKKEWKGIGTKRNCPKCHSPILYKDKWSYIYAVMDDRKCKVCVAKELSELNKILGKFKGKNNPFYGKTHSNKTKRKMSLTDRSYMVGKKNPMSKKSVRDKISKLLTGVGNPMFGKHHTKSALKKISIASKGKNNPMYGKPSPNGSGNGWANWYSGFHFRSLRELQYYISFIDGKCISCESAQKFRIPYKDYENVNRTYQPDFLVDGKFLVEVKPKKLWNTLVVKLKKKAAEKFCKKGGYKYLLVDVDPDSKLLKEKYLNGEIKFVEKYKERFEKYAGIK